MFDYELHDTREQLALPNSNTRAIKSELAARIVRLLDARGLTVRSAGHLTATAAADFSRIRQHKLDRFTVDRLIGILSRLDEDVEISVRVRQATKAIRSTGGKA